MLDLPYPGLRPFQPDKTHAYFGREKQTDELLDRLGDTRFLAVIGPSGCGKSSLVNTGLIASLELGLLASTGERWSVARMQPQNKPMHNLSAALIENGVVELPDKGEDPDADAGYHLWVENTLKRGPLGLKDVLDRHPLPERTNLLVVVDQFEEVFRYRDSINQQEADAFIALLLRSASLSEVPIYIVITMRSDFLGQCTVFPGLPEAINKGQFLTPRLTREEIKEAIEGPAEVYGGGIDPALTSRLLNAIGSSDDQLPVLQHALQRMWIRALEQSQNTTIMEIDDDESLPVQLSLDTYRLIGGIDNALSNHADEAFNELDEKGQTIAAYLFVALTERTNRNVDIRRPVSVGDVSKIANVPVADVIEVADRFRRPDRSFIVPSKSRLPVLSGDTLLDISHESLIRQWKRMVNWVEEEVEAASNYIRLEDSARLWRDNLTDFLNDIELDRLLQWRDERVPNRDWAKRYGTNFDLAMEYLEVSRANRNRKRSEEASQNKERSRSRIQQERQKWQKRGLVIAGLLIFVAVAGWWRSNINGDDVSRLLLANQVQTASFDAYRQKRYTASLLMRLVAHKVLDEGSVVATSMVLEGLINTNKINKIADNGKGRINAVTVNYHGDRVALAGRTGPGQPGWLEIRNRDGWKQIYSSEAPKGDDKEHTDGVSSISFSPDDCFLASGGYDGNILIRKVRGGSALKEKECSLKSSAFVSELKGAQHFVHNVIYNRLPDGGDFVISSGEEVDEENIKTHPVYFWPMQNGKSSGEREKLPDQDKVRGIAYAAKKGWTVLLTESDEKIQVTLWDVVNKQTVGNTFIVHNCKNNLSEKGVTCPRDYLQLAVSNNGKYLATLTRNKYIVLWSLGENGSSQKKAFLSGHNSSVLKLSFNGSQLASSSKSGEIFIWDIESIVNEEALFDKADLKFAMADLKADPKDEKNWLPVLQPKTKLPEQNDWVRSLAFIDDGTDLVSASGNNSTLWSIGDKRVLTTVLRGHEDEVWSLALSGSHLVTGAKDGSLKLWGNDGRETLSPDPFVEKGAYMSSLALNTSTGLLAIPYYSELSKKLQVREITSSGEVLATVKFEKDLQWRVMGVAFSPDGQFLAVSGSKGELLVLKKDGDSWSDTTIVRTDIAENDWRVTGWGDNLAFSSDSRRLFFGTEELIKDERGLKKYAGGLKKYAVRSVVLPPLPEPTYETLQSEVGEVAKVYSLAYASNCGTDTVEGESPCLLSAGEGNNLQIWRTDDNDNWSIQKTLNGHQDRVNTVTISPDGKTIASGSRDNTVRLWDLATGHDIGLLENHTKFVTRVMFMFSSDGNEKWLYSASDDTTIIRTNVNFLEYPDLVCNTIDRNLTCEEWAELKTEDPDYLQLCPNEDFKVESCE